MNMQKLGTVSRHRKDFRIAAKPRQIKDAGLLAYTLCELWMRFTQYVFTLVHPEKLIVTATLPADG